MIHSAKLLTAHASEEGPADQRPSAIFDGEEELFYLLPSGMIGSHHDQNPRKPRRNMPILIVADDWAVPPVLGGYEVLCELVWY